MCTDLLSRGVDLADPVDAVVQFRPARDLATHIHRVGRTARIGRPGHAVTIACRDAAAEASRCDAAAEGAPPKAHPC